MLIEPIPFQPRIASSTDKLIMRAALLLSLLKSSPGSPTVSNPSNSVARSFGTLDAQVPACIPGDQSIDGIRSRSCNEFGFKLTHSTNDKTKLTLGSSVGHESQLIAGATSHGTPAALAFTSPYLLASSSDDSINLLLLGNTALAAAFGLFVACAQSLINRLSSSGTAHLSGATFTAETPGSDAKSDGEVNFPSTVLDGTNDQDQESSPCPVEIYAHRQLALCDIGIQSIQYSELDDMFILIKPTLCKFVTN